MLLFYGKKNNTSSSSSSSSMILSLFTILFFAPGVQSFSIIHPHTSISSGTVTTTTTPRYLSKQQEHQQFTDRRSLVVNSSANDDGSDSTITMDTHDLNWKFQGHEVYTKVSKPSSSDSTASNNKKPIIVLVHGFGCSTTYWRRTISALVLEGGYEVHAVDLLGQGQSSKPNNNRGNTVEYSIHLWSNQIDTYIRDYLLTQNRGIILGGNSLGSLVALSTVTADYFTYDNDTMTDKDQQQQERHWARQQHRHNNDDNSSSSSSSSSLCRGIVMFNCGIGLNSRGIAKEEQWNPAQSTFINTLYTVLVVLIFQNYLLLEYALSNIITPELLQNTLQNLYVVNPQHVDEELVQSFYRPTQMPSIPDTVDVLSQIYCNDPGKTPMELHRLYPTLIGSSSAEQQQQQQQQSDDDDDTRIPIHLIWGDQDLVTPLEGSVGQHYATMASNHNSKVTMDIIQGGHIPFDDNPIESNKSLFKWLTTLSHE